MDLLDDDGLMDIGRRAKGTDPEAVTRELRSGRATMAPVNPALNDWAANLGRPGDAAPSGGCHVCGRTGRYTCNQCHRSACAADYWLMFGLCRDCAKEERVSRWHQDAAPEQTNWLGDTP